MNCEAVRKEEKSEAIPTFSVSLSTVIYLDALMRSGVKLGRCVWLPCLGSPLFLLPLNPKINPKSKVP